MVCYACESISQISDTGGADLITGKPIFDENV